MNPKNALNSIVLTLVLVSLAFAGCKTAPNNTAGIHQLDLVSLKDNPVDLGLSKLAKEIEYIPLETRPDVLLGSVKCCLGKEWIYILSRDQRVLLFNRSGKFVRTIGAQGKGPGEYIGAREIQISPDGTLIYLYSTPTNSCYVYKVTGEQYCHFELAYTAWRFARLSSGKHLMIAPYGDFTFTNEGKFLYYIQDSTGAVIRKYPSENIIRMLGNFSIGRFFITTVSLLAYVPFSDTVFQVDKAGEMSPKYALNFGKYRIPNEAHNDMGVLMQNQHQYITDINLIETEPWLFVSCSFQNEARVGFYAYDHSPVQSVQNTKGLIINDLDGGPNFFPAGSDGIKEVYSLLQPVDLFLQKKNGEFENKKFSKNDARKSFVKFMDTLKEDDNPVVVVVTLK